MFQTTNQIYVVPVHYPIQFWEDVDIYPELGFSLRFPPVWHALSPCQCCGTAVDDFPASHGLPEGIFIESIGSFEDKKKLPPGYLT